VPFYASALPGLHALHGPPWNIIFALGVLVLLVFLTSAASASRRR